MLEVNGKHVETDIQGFLQNTQQWSETFAKGQAAPRRRATLK